MLIRHARRSGSARWFGTSAGLAATSLTTKKLPSWLETKGRTRSFLFDEDNPVVNKEAHKLHKIHLGPENVKANPELARVLADDNVQSWQTNPYLSMLASPIRKCVWSDKAMPSDFLIAIKAASYEIHAADSPTGWRTKSSIFPRGLLHPAFSGISESRGRKEDRGYVVCRKTALHDYNLKGGKRSLDAASNPNPLLIYQTESSLRQRILQELKLIAGLPGDVRKWEEQHPAATTASEDSSETQEYLYSLSERVVKRIRSNQALAHRDLVEHTTTSPPIQSQVNVPAALLDFSDISSSNALILEGQVSSLLPYQSEQLEGYNLANLPKHRIPIYSVQSIFKLDSQEENESKEVSKKGQQTDQGTSWNILKRKYPTMYEREAQACQDQLSDFKQTMLSLIPSTQGEESLPSSIVAVPSMSRAMLPLLKALWRYRMWIGEGWSGDGFGVLEATGRK